MKYRTIVIDPPWPLPDSGPWTGIGGNWGGYVGGVSHIPYQTMTISEIRELPVAEMAENDGHLYLWTVNRFIEDAYDLARHWEFAPRTLLTWCKQPMGIGMGGSFSQTTEHILFCRRGRLKAKRRVDSTWYSWKRGPHSAKPEAFLDLVEQVSPGPYLELFARRNRLGWDTWGNECLEHVEMPKP